MKSIADRLKGIAWYNWILAVCVFLYLIYLSLSWFYLPGKLKTVTETDVSKMIGRKISVEKISYNPFTLSLSAKNFSVSDNSQKPLIAWDKLLVNFSLWRSLFSWEIAFEQINLDNPRINIIKKKEGFNFSDIIERLTAPDRKNNPQRKKEGKSISIALDILNTAIHRGKISYTDNSGTVSAGFNLDDVSLTVDKLYLATGDEHLNPFSLTASGPKGSQVKLMGNYRIDPLDVEGSIKVEGIDLSSFSGFVENVLPVRLSRGKLSISTNILAKKENQFILKTDKGNLSINNLVIDDSVPDPPMFGAGNIGVQDFSLDFTGKKIMVERVLLDKISVNQWIDKTGRPRYKDLLPEKKPGELTDKAEPSGKKTGAQWDLMIKQVSLKDSTVNFEDRNEKISRRHSLSGINLDLRDVSFAPESKILIKLAAMLDEKGGISADGSMCPSPFSMNLDYHLDKILLNPFSEYLEAASWLSIAAGNLSVDGKVSMIEGATASINTSASMGVDDLKVNDTRSGTPFLGLKALKLNGINAELDKHRLSIASVNLSKPDLNIRRSENKQLNLTGFIKEKEKGKEVEPATKAPAKASGKSRTWEFEIDKVSLDDGTVLFSDKSVKPEFKTGLYKMAFSLDKIGSDINKAAPFSFKSEIDKYAPFTIKGSLDPLEKQPGFAIQSRLKGLDMSPLSPYSDVYIGNNLKSGKLSLNLDYTLHGRKLKGKNNINAKNLYLGEKVPVEPVVKAPVGLGLALLRDLSGVIDLNVGISGNLDDPGFSVSGVIIKALVNIIIKAAASPFKLLGALIPGGGNEDLGSVTFEPGSSALNQANRDNLKNLVNALNKRPQLILSIKGNASGPEDIEALKIAHLKQLVAKKRGVSLSTIEEELKTQDLWMVAENRTALQQINNDMGLTAVKERLEKQSKPENSENKSTEAQDTLKEEQAVYKQVYDDIIAAEKIKDDELLGLADARALSIKQYLVDDLKLSQERVSEVNSTKSDLSGRVVKLELDAM